MTIAQQLNIQEFPFIIKDSDGNLIYREYSTGYWAKREYADGEEIYWEDSYGFWAKLEYAGDKVIRYEDCTGRIVDYRPKTDVQKAIELLTAKGLLTDGKILKN